MIAGFETYLRTHTSLSDENIERIGSLATARTLHRNELLLQQGQVCKHKTFIIKGLLRSFLVQRQMAANPFCISPPKIAGH